MRKPLVAIDLFSGAGGLTVGLKQAGFKVVTGVEIEPHAFSTYKANHPEVHALKQDVRTVTGKALLTIAGGSIDFLVGCPPCQGFSSLTSKWKKTDPRNELVLDMARLVEEITPPAVMMENVPGLVDRGKPLFAEFVKRLEDADYRVTYGVLQLADYGVPQNRRRLVLLAGRGFKIELPKPTHSRTEADGLLPWCTVRDAIARMPRPLTLDQANARGGPGQHDWHVVRTLTERNMNRLRAARPGKQRFALPNAMRPDCHKDTEEGFGNVYGRMRWGRIAPTITGGCTTLSKGRFGHPSRNTTISVREAATIQQFPDDYIFDCPYMDYVCNLVGNALPAGFAKIASAKCARALRRHGASSKPIKR
jgi:DNA (cytosine-5)-methyltransferase 1